MDAHSNPLPYHSQNYTYVAPFYANKNVPVTYYYRESNNTAILKRINEDIRTSNANGSSGFQAKHAFLVTFISTGTRFQIVLGSDGRDTYGVFNYEKLATDSKFDIGMNEDLCGGKRFETKLNSHVKLIEGNNTGVRGRFVHLLSSPGCFKKATGIRVAIEQIPISYQFQMFSTFTNRLTILGATETGKVLLYVKELTSFKRSPTAINIINGNDMNDIQQFITKYGIFYGGADIVRNMIVNNLLILHGTSKSKSFQFGTSGINHVESGIKCRKAYFDSEIQSSPIMKITGVIDSPAIPSFVNVWLQHVTSTSFTFCTMEMTNFSGRRDVKINYVAFVKESDQIEEAHVIPASKTPIIRTRCLVQRFKHRYLGPPSIFTSVEVVNKIGEPVIGWVNSVTNTSVEICIKPLLSPIISSLYNIHLIVKGQIDPCHKFTCPDHLECTLTSTLTPYCDCIKSCSADSSPFCGSDYHDHESLCLVNKDYCQKHGNYSKTNIKVKHFGKCQSKRT